MHLQSSPGRRASPRTSNCPPARCGLAHLLPAQFLHLLTASHNTIIPKPPIKHAVLPAVILVSLAKRWRLYPALRWNRGPAMRPQSSAPSASAVGAGLLRARLVCFWESSEKRAKEQNEKRKNIGPNKPVHREESLMLARNAMGPDISLPIVTVLSCRTSQMSIWERQMTQNRIYCSAKARGSAQGSTSYFSLSISR